MMLFYNLFFFFFYPSSETLISFRYSTSLLSIIAMAHVIFLWGVVAFTRTPSLALCAASPSLRLAAEHSTCGVRCGSYKTQSHMSTQWGIKMRALTVHPSVDFTLSSIQELVGWWLRRKDGAYIMIRWDDYYLARDFTLTPMALASTYGCLLQVLQLARCHIKCSMLWVSTCSYLWELTLSKCTFVNPYWGINWISGCSSLKQLKIQKCDCVIDFRVLAKLQYLLHLNIVTSRRLRYKRYIGKCQTLETVFIDAPCRFPLASTIAKLQSLLYVYIRCTSAQRVGSLQRCRLLAFIIIRSDTAIDVSTIGDLPRLQCLEVSKTAMGSIEWVGNCSSLTHLHITECPNITNISAIGRLNYIIYLSICGIDIDSIEWIRNCCLLETLIMSSCERITDLSPIGSLHYLDTLKMDIFRGDIEWIENCDLLQHIVIYRCKNITDYSCISCFHSLKRLALGYSSVRGIECIERCEQLTWLRIVGSRNIVGFSSIGKLKLLTYLDLSYTNLTDSGWSDLLNCESLEKLNVSHCMRIANFSPIASFTCLTDLDMSETRVADISWISSCKMLTALKISYCLHIVIFCPIGKLNHLEELRMSHTNVVHIGWMRRCLALKIAIIIGCHSILDLQEIKLRHPRVILVETDKDNDVDFDMQ